MQDGTEHDLRFRELVTGYCTEAFRELSLDRGEGTGGNGQDAAERGFLRVPSEVELERG